MLIQLEAFASLTGNEITLSMAREGMKDIIVEKTRDITLEMIQEHVAEHSRIEVSDLKSDKRIKTLVVPRQIVICICRELTKASYTKIGEKFGGKDHSTIICSWGEFYKGALRQRDLQNSKRPLKVANVCLKRKL